MALKPGTSLGPYEMRGLLGAGGGALEGEFPKVDPLMAGIRHESRFVESLARIERRLAEMRQRVDFSGLEELVPSPH